MDKMLVSMMSVIFRHVGRQKVYSSALPQSGPVHTKSHLDELRPDGSTIPRAPRTLLWVCSGQVLG